MSEDSYYITPHEAALAVVATSMKKARLRLDTLVINSIVGGVLFSAGGMLHLLAQAENPDLYEKNPGIVKLMQGALYPIGLFYVIIMGAELYNSNILYFSVGVCRGAVSILDLLVSWLVSWFFNLGANLFICYVICDLSGTTRSEYFIKGSIEITMDKASSSFIQTFIKGIAANFCVCLAVYLQLMAKPLHVKLLVMGLPIFTFVSMGFNHSVADMYLVPMGMFNGAPLPVATAIWKVLIPAALGNAVGGSIFGIVIPFYLHLVVVERDRKLLNLPKFDAKDEQPELEMDSRVIRVPSEKEEVENSSDSSDLSNDQLNPVSYRPKQEQLNHRLSSTSNTLSKIPTNSSRFSRLSQKTKSSLRSPPGVFPVKGMGEPLSRERSIASREDPINQDDSDDFIQSPDTRSLNSDAISLRTNSIQGLSNKERQKSEEDEYNLDGGYNARENYTSENLKKIFTRKNTNQTKQDLESGLKTSKTQSSSINPTNNSPSLFRTISKSFTQRQPDNAHEISRRLSQHSITPKAANASDHIAGIDSYDFPPQSNISKPRPIYNNNNHRRGSTLSRPPLESTGSLPRSAHYHMSHDNDYFEQQSVVSNLNHDE
ncbi:putative transporter [Wickerhamomyces ciferrii]|uniref:Transporter n=1 Tax=Wickerhamomyces ciferrii (strain ATCC 14091 / BCRC 22168 / CBS 111 / JCM 3599 / NBRC 0793 / NRRL Y-1031 F-60-10) TaxID=1206466 RepID=K0KIE3_WICCF|nr:putative transporter [Wickerhamomyces ciferrii]CCH41942.1 putative transporter [Wickerhamomyces ciferrii]